MSGHSSKKEGREESTSGARFVRPSSLVDDTTRFSRPSPSQAPAKGQKSGGPSGKSQRLAPSVTGVLLQLKPHSGKKTLWLRPGGSARKPKAFVASVKREIRMKKVGIRKPYTVQSLLLVRKHFSRLPDGVKPIVNVLEEGLGDEFGRDLLQMLTEEMQAKSAPKRKKQRRTADAKKEEGKHMHLDITKLTGTDIGLEDVEPITKPKPAAATEGGSALKKSKGGWKPSVLGAMDPLTKFRNNVRSILNKITLDNFGRLSTQIKEIFDSEIDSVKKLKVMVELIFEKTKVEPKFGPLYCKLCADLSNAGKAFRYEGVNEATGLYGTHEVTFKSVLLDQCGAEFTKNLKLFEAKSTSKDTDLDENVKKQFIGTIKFIGQLFRYELLPAAIVLKCLGVMLSGGKGDWPQPDEVEFSCVMLATVGKVMEAQLGERSMHVLTRYYSKLRSIESMSASAKASASVKYPVRIKILIRNLMDERSSGWKASADDDFGLVSKSKARGGKGGTSAFSKSVLSGTGLSISKDKLSAASKKARGGGIAAAAAIGGGEAMDDEMMHRMLFADAPGIGSLLAVDSGGDFAPVPRQEMKASMMLHTDIKAAAARERSGRRGQRRYGFGAPMATGAAEDGYQATGGFGTDAAETRSRIDAQSKLLMSSFTSPTEMFGAGSMGSGQPLRPGGALPAHTYFDDSTLTAAETAKKGFEDDSSRHVTFDDKPPTVIGSRIGAKGPELDLNGEDFKEEYTAFLTGEKGEADILGFFASHKWEPIKLITRTLRTAMDGNDSVRDKTTNLWSTFAKKRFVTLEEINEAMHAYFSIYTDEKSDCPKLAEYLSQLVAPMVLAGELTLQMVDEWINANADEMKRPWKRRKNVTNQQQFIGCLFHEIRENAFQNRDTVVQNLVKKSGFPVEKYITDDIKEEWADTCSTKWFFS